jgi:fermentation-respiration switch protein FrsA (DUF1100 family)
LIAVPNPHSARLLSVFRFVGGIILLGTVSIAVAVTAAGMFLSRPAQAVIGSPPPELHAENVAFSSPSGAILHGWFIAGQPGVGAVVLMHGVRSNRLSMIRRAQLLNSVGFSILLFDFQAHGESTGARITFGQLEGMDASAAVAFVRHRLPAERVGAIGTSLGGAAALLGPEPLSVDALVLESVYPDIEAAIADRIRSVLGPIFGSVFASPLTKLFELLLPPVLNIDPTKLRPIDHIAQARGPVLVASGTRDDHTTIAEASALFDRARESKIFWAVPDAGHVDLESFAPEAYRLHVLSFLVEALQRVR